MMRHYSYDQAKAITRQFRKAGVWGWYLNDFEDEGLHVHTHLLENEFQHLDRSASTLLDWYSLESNNHILNLPTIYVGGQMLWDNRVSSTQKLDEFCTEVWGPGLAPKVSQALQAIADVRCGPGRHWLRDNLWPHDFMCWMGRGSTSTRGDLALCEAALRGLASAPIDPAFVPKLPLTVDPGDLLGYIKSHLGCVSEFARIRVAYAEAISPAVEEGQFDKTQEKMAALPQLPDYIPGLYGAAEETFYYRLLLKFAETWKGRTFSDNLALKKKATASSSFNNDPRFSPDKAVNGILCEFEEEGWAANEYGPAWLKIDLGRVSSVKSVRIYNRGYHREIWDNNLIATPVKADVFYATEDRDPTRGSIDGKEPGYKMLGGFDKWAPTDDPSAFQEIHAASSVLARFIKVLIYKAAHDNPVGCGEVEVR